MLTVLIIIVAVLAVAALAFLIVNKVPKKARPIISIVLWGVIGFLAWQIYNGVMSQVNFKKEKEARYSKVIDRLKIIRDAEVAYKQVTGKFTDKPAVLIKFIDTAKFAITEVRNDIREVNKGTVYNPIMIKEEFRVVDTVGYKPVAESFKDRDYKNMFKVPDTDKSFELKTGLIEKVQGVKAPVFLAQIDKGIVLKGMDRNLVKQEKEAFGGPEVAGEFISVGSLDDVVTSGNWPPFYDTGEEEDKE